MLLIGLMNAGTYTEALRAVFKNNVAVFGLNNSDIEAWNGFASVLESTASSLGFGTTSAGDIYLMSNAYYLGSGSWKYKATNAAIALALYNGTLSINVAASGTIDNALTWSNVLKILNSGYMGLGGVITPTVGLELPNTATSGKIICYDLYAYNNVSAHTFTDRTEAFIDDALAVIAAIKATEVGEIDHSTLPMFAVEPYQDEKGEWWPGRSVNNMVSVHTKAIQELITLLKEKDDIISNLTTRIEALEERAAS